MKTLAALFVLALSLEASASIPPQNRPNLDKAVLSHAESTKVLDTWRHSDQDAYGSETFDYHFMTFQCFKFAQDNEECDLLYRMTVAKEEDQGPDGKITITAPAYDELETPDIFVAADKSYHGEIKFEKSAKKHRNYYQGHCALKMTGDIKKALFDDAHGSVQNAFYEQLNNCLAKGDADLTKDIENVNAKK